MPHRPKILILENDDFLRELLGNLLHKQDYFILNGVTVAEGVEDATHASISTVILGTSCTDFDGKSTINYLKQKFGPELYIYAINTGRTKLGYLPASQQIKISDLSVEKIIETIKKR